MVPSDVATSVHRFDICTSDQHDLVVLVAPSAMLTYGPLSVPLKGALPTRGRTTSIDRNLHFCSNS